ncbi:RNA polymerase subunit sigma-24, partial [bacterium]|nr:RNA polymerase subunit sigma-24 [bacterium]
MRRPVENTYPGLGDYAVKLIRTRARELVRSGRFTAADQDDLEQELVIDLLKRFPKFYPAFAKEVTFVQRIIDHKVASLIDAQSAMVRDYRMRKASLHHEVEDGDGDCVERWETLDEARYL